MFRRRNPDLQAMVAAEVAAALEDQLPKEDTMTPPLPGGSGSLADRFGIKPQKIEKRVDTRPYGERIAHLTTRQLQQRHQRHMLEIESGEENLREFRRSLAETGNGVYRRQLEASIEAIEADLATSRERLQIVLGMLLDRGASPVPPPAPGGQSAFIDIMGRTRK